MNKWPFILVIIILLACVGAIFYLGSLRPFAPVRSQVAGAPTAEDLRLGAADLPTASPTGTNTPTAGHPVPSETETSVSAPESTGSLQKAVRIPKISATLAGTPDISQTETAVPANATFSAIETRAYATLTPAAGPSPTPRLIDSTTNFLLLGSDLRPDDPSWVASTDVIMVLFVDGQNSRAALLSFPRDLIVAIPGYDAFRINYVYHYGERHLGPGGGPQLLKRVLQDEFGIHVDHWAMIDLNGYQKIIDTLGGIDLHVNCALQDTIDQQGFVIPAGEVHMDSLTARRYIQSRYTSSDTSRNFRQQHVLWAMARKGLQLGALDKLPTLWGQLHDVVQTDLSLFDMAGLIPLVHSIDPQNHPERVHAAVLEYPKVYPYISPYGAWLYMPDYGLVANQLAHIFDAPPVDRATVDQGECPPVTITPEPTATPGSTSTPGAP